ncbi:MFS transporter [Streptomyces sp. NPDC058001]|uniref:MFS transporter n=1 Tax=Streptomyces sp. NPDC058001 TaxID=3346300 RepID=UPI0036F14047
MAETSGQKYRSLWRDSSFAYFWGSQAASFGGTQVTMVALPLIAVFSMDATPFEVGVLAAVERVPFVVLSLPAGALIERMNHRRVLVTTAVLRMVLILTVPLAAALDLLTIGHLYLTAVLIGALSVFADVTGMSVLPALLPADRLADGNGKLEAGRSGADVLGPGLGGLLVQTLTAPFALLADALAFAVSGLLMSRVRPVGERVREAHGEQTSLVQQIREGVKFVVRTPLLLWNAVAAALLNLFAFVFLAIQYLYMVDTLGMSAAVVGLVLALGGLGGVLGSMLSGRLIERLGLGRAFVFGSAAVALGILIAGAAPHQAIAGPAVLAVGYFMYVLGGPVFNVAAITARQVLTPDHLLARTNATMRFFIWSSIPLGALLGGLFATLLGLRGSVLVAGVGLLIPLAVLSLSPIRRMSNVERSGAE